MLEIRPNCECHGRAMSTVLRPLAGVVALALLLLVDPRPAWACSCLAPGELVEEARESDVVFSGTVRRAAIDRRADSPLMARIKSFFGIHVRHGPEENRFSIEVDEPFKGVGSSTVEVVTSVDSASCGYAFEIGRKYLVFAQRHEARIHVSLCSATAPVEGFSATDLARLRTLQPQAAPAAR